jgi:hypothetical protein
MNMNAIRAGPKSEHPRQKIKTQASGRWEDFFRPCGTGKNLGTRIPSDKSLGYFRTSLWDYDDYAAMAFPDDHKNYGTNPTGIRVDWCAFVVHPKITKRTHAPD